jgi:catechol 2,3-dioxygenase-like lactoylglutathione lyase family enzyme
MKAHVSSILLGVQDLDRSKRFYTEGLGWKVERDYRVSVFFESDGGSLVGFYGREGLAAQVGAGPDGSGFSGLVLTYVVRGEARVDEILEEARKAGATILKPAAAKERARTAVRSPIRTATSGTSGTAPKERTNPMPSSRAEEHRTRASDPDLSAWLGRLQDESFSRAGPAVRKAYPPQRRMTGPQLAGYLARRTYALASSTRPDGRAHAVPTLFTAYAEAFWLPTRSGAARLGNVRARPWLALSIVEGEHDTHAAVLTEGPAQVLETVPQDVRTITELRNEGGSLDWASAWLRMTPQRLFSFAELAWPGATRRS